MSTGVNVARRLWDRREELREAYEAVHGSDPGSWPHRHPGIVIDAVQFVVHAACLGCQWIDQPGTSIRNSAGVRPPLRQRAATKVRAVNRTSSSCRWCHPALKPSTLGRVIHNLLYGNGDAGSFLTRFVRV